MSMCSLWFLPLVFPSNLVLIPLLSHACYVPFHPRWIDYSTLNKQSRRTNKGWAFSLWDGGRANKSSPWKRKIATKCYEGQGILYLEALYPIYLLVMLAHFFLILYPKVHLVFKWKATTVSARPKEILRGSEPCVVCFRNLMCYYFRTT